MHKPSTLEPDKESAKSTFEKETGANTEGAESGRGKTSEPSTGNGEKLPDPDDEIPKLALSAEEFSGNNDTTETVHGKTSQNSTGNGKKSLDPDGELPKSTSGIEEEDELSPEEVGGWEFDELVNELKDDNQSSQKNTKISPGKGAGFDSN